MTYQARKPGLYDQQIIKAKERPLMGSYKGRKAKAAVIALLYGKRPATDLEKAIAVRITAPIGMGAHSFTEHGDFTHLAGRGI